YHLFVLSENMRIVMQARGLSIEDVQDRKIWRFGMRIRQQLTSSTTTSSSSDGGVQKGEVRTWLDGLNSPLIQDEGENKKLKLRFDVSQYQPEEIVVKTVDNKLLVHAKHEEKSESKSVYREYNREFMLPKGTNPESIKSSLSKDGVLTVEAPLPAIEGEKLIPIAQQ
ncbi:hypothetical protein L9F63_025758, partial [Diploptera punctata]